MGSPAGGSGGLGIVFFLPKREDFVEIDLKKGLVPEQKAIRLRR
jgi:hypothetical protein